MSSDPLPAQEDTVSPRRGGEGESNQPDRSSCFRSFLFLLPSSFLFFPENAGRDDNRYLAREEGRKSDINDRVSPRDNVRRQR